MDANTWARIVDGRVTNLELWTQPPEVDGATFVQSDLARIGDHYDDGGFTAPAPQLEPLPPEIPMHQARKALRIMGPLGEDDPNKWWPQVIAAIEAIPNEISRGCVMDELDTAPNLVLAGASTTMVRAAIGMTDEHLEMVARKALTLP